MWLCKYIYYNILIFKANTGVFCPLWRSVPHRSADASAVLMFIRDVVGLVSVVREGPADCHTGTSGSLWTGSGRSFPSPAGVRPPWPRARPVVLWGVLVTRWFLWSRVVHLWRSGPPGVCDGIGEGGGAGPAHEQTVLHVLLEVLHDVLVVCWTLGRGSTCTAWYRCDQQN